MSVIEENIKRNQILDAVYNPYTGEGSTLDRELFELSDLEEKLYLPKKMMAIQGIQELAASGSMSEYAKQIGQDEDDLRKVFLDLRLDFDFEFWCATCVSIKPKKGGSFIPFVLNYPQRLLFAQLNEMMSNLQPILFVLLKSRQFGGSTLIDILQGYIQIRHKMNWNSLIVAHVNQAAINIRSMMSNLILYYPSYINEISLKPFEQTHNIKIIPERSNKITIGSMETPDSVRSDDIKMAHISEAGLMKKTQGKEPEDLIQSILGSMPIDEPYTMFGIESTAKGVGNYFHRTWQEAVKGNNAMKAIFIPWYMDQKNRIHFSESDNQEDFYNSLNDYERFLWCKGATLEGIKFYRKQLSLFNGDKWRMQSEFPTTPDEAFQSTGNRYFPSQYVLALRKDNREPIFKGEIIGDSTIGKKSLDNITLQPNERGNLWIWEMPEQKNEYDYRYVVSMDIGGTTDKADYSVIRAFDRLPMITGNDPVAILTWKGHIDQDLLSWLGVRIAKFCDNALFVPEDNSLEKEEDGEHFQTILNQIKDFYSYIYVRNDEEKVGSDFVPKWGWNTNKKTKGLAVDTLRSASRERMNRDENRQDGYCYKEYDERTCSEMDCFEIKQNGKLGATDGEHDDMVMSTAIGLHVAINIMPLPRLKRIARRTQTIHRSESSF